MRRPTAIRALSVWINCRVDLLKDGGSNIDGIWSPNREVIGTSIKAVEQKASASEIRRFERGGERLENATRLYLAKRPLKRPDYVMIRGESFKVFEVDFRDESRYWKLIVAREL